MKSCGRALALLACLIFPSLGRTVICPDPDLQWSRTYNNGAVDGDEAAMGLAVDASDNLIAAGSEETSNGADWLVIKHDPAGVEAWRASYNNATANGDDAALDVDVDGAGDVYVAGYEVRTEKPGGRNWHVRKYAAAGTFLTATDLYGEGETSSVDDEARAIAVSPSGSVYVGGFRDINDPTGRNWHIRCYTSGLSFLRAWMYDSPAGDDDVINGLAVDQTNGDFVAVGYDTRSDLAQGRDWLIRKRDGSTGNLLWARVHDGPASGDDEAHDVAIDASGNVYVAGCERTGGEGLNWLVKAFSSSGDPLWSDSYNSPGNSDEEARAIAVDLSGNILVAGYEDRPDVGLGESDNWLVRKYRPDGSLAWSRTFDGAEHGEDRALAVAGRNSATVIVGGFEDSGFAGEGLNLLIKKYMNTACLEPYFTFDPPDPVVSEHVKVYLTVSNSGAVDAANVAVEFSLGAGLTNLALLSNPDLSGTFDLPAGSATIFEWTYSIAGCGMVDLSVTATGMDASSGNPLFSPHVQTLDTLCPARLVNTIHFQPDPGVTAPSEGRWVKLFLTVSNVGDIVADAVSATLFLTPLTGVVSLIEAPPSLTISAIPPGGATTFVWTYSVAGVGTARFGGFSHGTDTRLSKSLLGSVTEYLETVAAARLIAAVIPEDVTVSVGQLTHITVRVTNTGGVLAYAVVPDLTVTSGAAFITTNLVGPIPSGPSTILPANHEDFVWSATITGVGTAPYLTCGTVNFGTVYFSATATGLDSGTDNPIAGWGSNYLRTFDPVVLSPALSLVPRRRCLPQTEVPPPPSVGQLLDVRLTVSNTGGNWASDVAPRPNLAITAGAGNVVKMSGPTPTIAPLLPGTCATEYVWTYEVIGSGYVAFTATVSGWDLSLGQQVSAAASANSTIVTYSALDAVQTLDPTTLYTGLTATVTFTVTNTGTVAAQDVTATLVVESGGDLVLPLSWPGAPVTVPAGGSQTFTWTLSATGPGEVVIRTQADWDDAGTGCPLTVLDKRVLTVLGIPQLLGSLTVSPALSPVREWVELSLLVTNAGSGPALNVFPPLPVITSGVSLVGAPSGPVPSAPVNLEIGESAAFTWRYVGQAPGTVEFSADANAVDIVGAPMTLASPATASLVLLGVADALPYPNPFNPDNCASPPCRLKFHNLPLGSRVKIYTVSGLLVWEAEFEGVPVGWDGLNTAGEDVSPGIYLWLIEAPQGRQKGKVILRR